MRLAISRTCLFLFTCVFCLLPSAAFGARVDFVFKNSSTVSGLQFRYIDEAHFTGGGLLLEGTDNVKIGPSTGFKAPLRRVAMELRVKTPQSLILVVRVKSINGWEAVKSLMVDTKTGEDEERVLRFYLGKPDVGKKTGNTLNYIDNFVISFSGSHNIKVRLDSLSFYEPTALGRLSLYWEEFWRPDFIIGTTVGFVTTPEAGGVGVLSMLYVFIGMTFIATIIFYLAGGLGLSSRKAAKNFVIIFLLAGLLFAIRMDYNWLTIWRDDIKTLSGLKPEERIRIKILDFVNFVKRTVPAGRSVRPVDIGHDSPLATIARYYMLPTEDSSKARFLWSYGETLRLDAASGALYDADGNVVAPRVRLFARYSDRAAIYEVIK